MTEEEKSPELEKVGLEDSPEESRLPQRVILFRYYTALVHRSFPCRNSQGILVLNVLSLTIPSPPPTEPSSDFASPSHSRFCAVDSWQCCVI